MGYLREGQWHTDWYDTDSSGGKFVRDEARFRHWVTTDGSPGPTGQGGFEAAADRYHLYVSYACPWAHRTLIMRELKDLAPLISVSVVDPDMLDQGWTLSNRFELNNDPVNGASKMYQVYLKAKPDCSGRVTVPVLWDKKNATIVSNESSEIIRMFNCAFDHLTGNQLDFYPSELQSDIDSINEPIYNKVNNGVYRCGFATTQSAYEEAYGALFEELDRLEQLLGTQRYLVGARLTEADWRLFTTLIRFDAVYVGHFKCNQRRILDYPSLSNYLLELYQYPGIAATVHMDHIKRHYYYSHETINPTRVVPLGPDQDFTRSHDRAKFPSLNS